MIVKIFLLNVWHSDNLIGALAGCRTPRGHVTVTAAPLLLQLGTVAVLISVGTGVGWRRHRSRV